MAEPQKITFNDKAGRRSIFSEPGVWAPVEAATPLQTRIAHMLYKGSYRVPGPIKLKASS